MYFLPVLLLALYLAAVPGHGDTSRGHGKPSFLSSASSDWFLYLLIYSSLYLVTIDLLLLVIIDLLIFVHYYSSSQLSSSTEVTSSTSRILAPGTLSEIKNLSSV